jgi:hypothetical protein
MTVMVTRPELVRVVTKALGLLPERSVNVLGMELGKAGLISTAGRGPHAAQMTSRDAVSLVSAAMAGGHATATASTTRRILASRFIGPGEILPFDSFAELGTTHSFGTAFEALMEEFILNRETHDGWPFIKVSGGNLARAIDVSIVRTITGELCKIEASLGKERCRAIYLSLEGQLANASQDEREHLLSHVVAAESNLRGIYVTTQISGVELAYIADALSERR